MSKKMRAVLATSILASAAFPPAMLPQPVIAGSNGQQVFFACQTYADRTPKMDYGVVKGYNQSEKYVESQRSAQWATDHTYTYIFTQGWWWVETVRIYWHNPKSNSWMSMLAYVPPQQSGDTSSFYCPASVLGK